VTPALFVVRLAPPTIQTVTVGFATSDLTAQAGSDYLATNGVLTFSPGVIEQTFSVTVLGDTNAEPTETSG